MWHGDVTIRLGHIHGCLKLVFGSTWPKLEKYSMEGEHERQSLKEENPPNFTKTAFNYQARELTDEERLLLEKQNSRLVTGYQAAKLERDAKKYWDLFYKRNDTRFFKDRHWTTREFEELLGATTCSSTRVLLEVGCGVGNFLFPLIEEGLDLFVYACDISAEAIRLLKENPLYSDNIKAFQADITSDQLLSEIPEESVNIVTLIFVLSAIHPDKFSSSLRTIFRVSQPGGIVLFRDYGLYDMAQLRFKAGNKISENCYMRQDGTSIFLKSASLRTSSHTATQKEL
ncbi:tRNA N(3)-methylcytidine methyltransferase METTL6 isoform X2 [Anabrus simplex]|uniref:tRNA N(3)-methylcytidine methyltransferase METTL6 isoform X2 n=1 Tax=Anabrus simplex TaxID=316456 RepID=UPI0035A3C189